MDGYVGDTVNDSVFSRSWVPSRLRGPAHADVHGATPASASGISATAEYNDMTANQPSKDMTAALDKDLVAAFQTFYTDPVKLPSEKPRSDTLATDLSVAAGNVVALCLERHAKYGALNISNTPGGALSGIIVRLFDKLSRLAHSGADFADESVNDTINDIVGYGLIASLVVNNKWPKS